MSSRSRKRPSPLVSPEPPVEISKGDFLRLLEEAMKKSKEVSWVTTDVYSFDWGEINLNRSRFIQQLDMLIFKKAVVGIFDPNTKRMEYLAFDITDQNKP